jgi:hypothetical protein
MHALQLAARVRSDLPLDRRQPAIAERVVEDVQDEAGGVRRVAPAANPHVALEVLRLPADREPETLDVLRGCA